ncbi:MAG: uroporphyrinogen-III C-methyltransferase [Deltaproteobacteria bacterium]|nr:uroporphyrinogen-III C-methyltransferase [Deltaproteobacteria bacterium]
MIGKGKVYIIGAGPGDPGLITLRGAAAIREADVVIYDHLAAPEILGHARENVRLIYAGKQGGDHTLSQDEINRRLVEEAGAGAVVARLKGGDPFVFGRGGEEAEVLRAAGIPFEIVPGVTSAIAVPAYAGIPLTHRNHTSTVAFVTGHEDPTKGATDIDWSALARIGTCVFLMGVKNLPIIAENLIRSGREAATPAALVRRGTTPDQATLTGTLGDIAQKATKSRFAPPAVLVVGGVVGLRDTLNWFETKPLFGRGVVITRPEAQAEEFAELLRAAGARVIPFPVIRIAEPQSWGPLDSALERIEAYRWIVFTSANGVGSFFRHLPEKGRDIRDLKGIRIATIGPATAQAVRALGIRVDLVPEEFVSEGVVRAFGREDLRGCRVLLPRAEQARDVIPEGLEKLGARVDVVAVYRTLRSERDAAELLPLFAAGEVDVIAFTSPSTVTNFLGIMGPGFHLPPKVRIACIGPVTAAAAEKAGLTVDILQERYTVPELVDAIAGHFQSGSGAASSPEPDRHGGSDTA